jgi:aspartate/methionine/tyrosine aminotransferase
MSEDIDEGRRRFLGTAAVTIGATSAAAGAFSLLPQPPAEAVVPAARWPNT